VAQCDKIRKNEVLQALAESLGNVSQACKAAGVSRQTFYRWKSEEKTFRDAVEEQNDVALDFAEQKLFELIAAGSERATIFLLKTRGKHRGYTERIEPKVSSFNPEPIIICTKSELEEIGYVDS